VTVYAAIFSTFSGGLRDSTGYRAAFSQQAASSSVLQPRPTPPPRPPARAAPGAPRLIRRPPSCCWCHRLRGDRSASRAAWTAARVTLSGPDVLVKLAYLYSNPLPGPETLAELRDRASARLRSANHAPVRQVQHRLGPARIEELITAYRRGPRRPPSLFHSTFIAGPSPRYSSGQDRLTELGVCRDGLGGCQTLGVELVHPGPFDVPGPAQLLEDPDQPSGDVNLSLQNAVTGAARVGVV
jgi:hypothetical protein